MAIFMPTTQKRLTNVSIVRLRKGGKRFEVATYPNKVKAWRDHLETDLDEVLQTQTIFLNVSKGEEAKKDLLEKVFNTSDKEDICKQILLKGEIQVTGKERHSNLDALFSDVAKMISQKCINPTTQRAYSVAIIEKAMRACHVKLLPTRSAKQQVTEVIGILRESDQLNLEITLLHVHLVLSLGERLSAATAHRVRKFIRQEVPEVLVDELDECVDLNMEFLVEPGALNEVEGRIRDETRGRYQMDISRSEKTKSIVASKEENGEADDKELSKKISSMAISKDHPETKHPDGQKKRRRRGKKGDDSVDREVKVVAEVPKDDSDDDWDDSKKKRRGRKGKRDRSGKRTHKNESSAVRKDDVGSRESQKGSVGGEGDDVSAGEV